jgi:uncharacterized membrane protein
MTLWRMAGVALTFGIFFFGGLGHLMYPVAVARIVPGYIPFPQTVVLLTGACEIVGALALFWRPLRWPAGIAFALYLVCVSPVHIDMLVHADRWRQYGLSALWLRLLLQPVLIVMVLAATRPQRKGSFS